MYLVTCTRSIRTVVNWSKCGEIFLFFKDNSLVFLSKYLAIQEEILQNSDSVFADTRIRNLIKLSATKNHTLPKKYYRIIWVTDVIGIRFVYISITFSHWMKISKLWPVACLQCCCEQYNKINIFAWSYML